MFKKIVMVVSIVLALVCAACVGVCVFNLPTADNLIGFAIGMVAAFSLFAYGFLHTAFLAHAELVAEQYEYDEDESDDEIEIVFIPDEE